MRELDRQLRGWHTLLDRYTEDTYHKGRHLLEDGKVTPDDEAEGIWWVQGNGKKPYRVGLISYEDQPSLTCTCPNGRNRGGLPSCYHTAAVALLGRETVVEAIEMEKEKRSER